MSTSVERNAALWAMAMMLALLMTGCSGGPSGPAGGAVRQAVTAATGGQVDALGGAVSLLIPGGALAQDTLVGIDTATGQGRAQGVFSQVGRAYDITPASTVLNAPAVLTLRYTPAELRAAGIPVDGDLGLARWAGSLWDIIAPSQVDRGDLTVSADITRFGRYAIIGRREFAGALLFAWAQDTDGNGRLTTTDATQIHAIDDDGSNLRTFVSFGVEDRAPRISPDGSHMVFASFQASEWRLYSLDLLRPSAPQLVSALPAAADLEAYEWSPDSQQIAYTSDAPETIRVAGADGSNNRAIANGAHPSWAPDSTTIAYGFAGTVRTIPVAGGASQTLSQGFAPRWSSDPNLIAFVSVRDGRDTVYVRDLVTGTDQRIAEGFGSIWSPAGDALAFVSPLGLRVAEIDPDGKARSLATVGPTRASGPAWSADGRRIAFVSDATGTLDVYTVGRDGDGLTRLTSLFQPDEPSDPEWFPMVAP